MVDAATVIPGAEAWSATGSGDRADTVVVLVHGFTANPKGTRPLAELLHDDGFTVNAVRMPGHGTTLKDLARTRYADWRTAVTGAVDQALRDHERVVLVGHSTGGTLALDLAGHRDDIAAVVAINPFVEAPTTPLARIAPLLQYIIPSLPREAAGLPPNDIAKPGVSEDAYDRVPTKTTQSLLDALGRVRDGLPRLTAPLLLVSSRVDHTVDPGNGDLVAQWVGSTDLRRMFCERSYHVPQLDWEREEVETAVRSFVAEMHDAAVAAPT